MRIFRKRINFSESNEKECLRKFRLPKFVIQKILRRIQKYIKPKATNKNNLSSKEKLLLTLNLLGCGSFQRCIALQHCIAISTVCKSMHKVCRAIVKEFLDEEIAFPADSDIPNIKQAFAEIANLPPFVIGCIDGSLVNIQAPIEHEHQYVDRKGNHSINLSAISGPNGILYWISCCFPGSVHDARVFKESILFQCLLNNNLLPPNSVLLGDSAYPLMPFLIPPTLRNSQSRAEKRFVDAHCKTRQTVERAFGMLKKIFPCLKFLRYSPQKAATIIKACCILYNMRKRYYMCNELIDDDDESDEYDLSEDDNDGEESASETEEENENVVQHRSLSTLKQEAENMRNTFISHFQ